MESKTEDEVTINKEGIIATFEKYFEEQLKIEPYFKPDPIKFEKAHVLVRTNYSHHDPGRLVDGVDRIVDRLLGTRKFLCGIELDVEKTRKAMLPKEVIEQEGLIKKLYCAETNSELPPRLTT